jgi:hypothetical protein
MRIVRAHASETALMEIIVAIKGTLQKVMRVGHNPGQSSWLGRRGEKSGNCTVKLSTLRIPQSTSAEF